MSPLTGHLRENVRANLRRLVKRILRKYGYPPDKQEQATVTVLEQAETLSEGWAMALGAKSVLKQCFLAVFFNDNQRAQKVFVA